MDSKDVLHVVATLSRTIGEDNMVQELDEIGWRGIKSHPVEFFKSYLIEFDHEDDLEDKIELILADMSNIGVHFGLELNGDEFVDIVPR